MASFTVRVIAILPVYTLNLLTRILAQITNLYNCHEGRAPRPHSIQKAPDPKYRVPTLGRRSKQRMRGLETDPGRSDRAVVKARERPSNQGGCLRTRGAHQVHRRQRFVKARQTAEGVLRDLSSVSTFLAGSCAGDGLCEMRAKEEIDNNSRSTSSRLRQRCTKMYSALLGATGPFIARARITSNARVRLSMRALRVEGLYGREVRPSPKQRQCYRFKQMRPPRRPIQVEDDSAERVCSP